MEISIQIVYNKEDSYLCRRQHIMNNEKGDNFKEKKILLSLFNYLPSQTEKKMMKMYA